MTKLEYEDLQKGDAVYLARIMPKFGYYEIHDVVIVTKCRDYCVACETKTKQSFLLFKNDIADRLHINRDDALTYLREEEKKNKDVKVYSKTKESSTESEEE